MTPGEFPVTTTLVAIAIVVALVLLAAGLFTVEQQDRAIIERFGKFARVAGPGLNVKIPLIERRAATINLMVDQVQLEADTKTKDNVFVKIHFAVNYRIDVGRETLAYYGLADVPAQIRAYALDSVRSHVPNMDLDHVFERKDDIANAIQQHVGPAMGQYGIVIVSCLVIDISPAAQVVAAMNDIQAQARLQVAAASKGEARGEDFGEFQKHQAGRGRGRLEAPAGRGHRQPAQGDHGRVSGLGGGVPEARRRRSGSRDHADAAADAIP